MFDFQIDITYATQWAAFVMDKIRVNGIPFWHFFVIGLGLKFGQMFLVYLINFVRERQS